MNMAVYAAGHDVEAGCVDDLVRLRQRPRKRRDAAFLNADIALECIAGGDDRSITDDLIEAHGRPFLAHPARLASAVFPVPVERTRSKAAVRRSTSSIVL